MKRHYKFDIIEVNKKKIHKYKQSINLNLVDTNKIVISDRFKHNNDGVKYFIGYKENNIIRPLCIILSQTSGYIKIFENRRKSLFFIVKGDRILVKYNEVGTRLKRFWAQSFVACLWWKIHKC